MEILETFGFSLEKFAAQVIIVGIVFFILYKSAYGPVLAMLEQRRRRIADGEANLEKIREQMEQAESNVQEKIDKANAEADRMIAEAKDSAESVREQKTQAAIVEAGKIIAKANEAAKLEHEQLMAELKGEFGRLVIDTTEKVTGKVLDNKDQERINQETAGQVAL
ncbi:MAG: F0F1 ATP synthase subunit B [Verrucomicrobiales bacterium]|nr:F0F1 ATP synthase subunit B [Verrucomicrobiales bacterium]